VVGLPRCLTFSGPRVDAAVAREILRAVEPMAIEAHIRRLALLAFVSPRIITAIMDGTASIPADQPVGQIGTARAPQRPTPCLGISDSNFDVQREYSSL
jgi:hypothetical protein